MKRRFLAFFRIETIIILLVFVAFSLLWIKWGKLSVYGWDLPSLYKKTTKISNTVLFFSKKESPHLAYFVYIVPALAAVSFLFLMNLKFRTANLFLFLTCAIGFALSLYMYNYMLTSKIFKFVNTGAGIHLLCAVSFIGIFYSLAQCFRKKKNKNDEVNPEQPPGESIQTENSVQT